MITLTVCSQSVEKSSADTGLVETEVIERITTAADIHVVDNYSFAVSDDVIEGYDTYKKSKQIKISTKDQVNIEVYGSNQPIDNIVEIEPILTHSFNQVSDEVVLKEQFTYYLVVVDSECDLVIATD